MSAADGQRCRAPSGGRIDRSRPIGFIWEGRALTGYAGDTLASALVANGVRLLGRSFKYHRPRGLLGAGPEEPNVLVQLGTGAATEPNLRATEIELVEGLVAGPVNCWPSARFDLGAVNDRLSRFLPAGFYYKTFMWPNWHLFEGAIRRAAGLGRAPAAADPDRYETRYAHCDVLVVGAGPAGLAAARAAAAGGQRVMLVEQDSQVGGSLLWSPATIDGRDGADWARGVVDALASAERVRILTRTTAIGYYDQNAVALVERGTGDPRMRLWQVRAKRVVLATGGIERALVFPGNDRPGVMLASAAAQYAVRYAARAGERAVLLTNNDSSYALLDALTAAGGRVTQIVDTRAAPPPGVLAAAAARGIAVATGAAVTATRGRGGLTAVQLRDGDGRCRWVACDLLAMSGGWNPTVHLFTQSGGVLRFDAGIAGFVPNRSAQAETSIGLARGTTRLSQALAEGHAAGVADTVTGMAPPVAGEDMDWTIEPRWRTEGRGKAFVDFQNDVTVDDIALAARENFRSVEHLKRYTTLGMAPDQGKTSNVNAAAILGALTAREPGEVGTTRYRPPFTPVALGALAANASRPLLRPIQRLAVEPLHEARGAAFEDYGSWRRPAWYGTNGSTFEDARAVEMRAVRTAAGLFDASSLGKIEVRGPDAARFLDRVYANAMASLKVGRLRYGLMLGELGVIIDDGVVARLADDRFLVGTTSSAAARIADWLEEWLQCEWRDLEVVVAPVTSAFAVPTVAGPAAREVLAAAGCSIDLSPAAFPHMTWRDGVVAGYPVRIARASYTGELSYEISTPTRDAARLWTALETAGEAVGLRPVGLEAWLMLRAEKGFIHIGADTDGTTLPDDIGWGHVGARAGDFIGKRSLSLPEACRPDRMQLVGVRTVDPAQPLHPGHHLFASRPPALSEGYMTSAGPSEALGGSVAMAMVRRGRARVGERLHLAGGGMVEVTPLVAYDPEGERLRG